VSKLYPRLQYSIAHALSDRIFSVRTAAAGALYNHLPNDSGLLLAVVNNLIDSKADDSLFLYRIYRVKKRLLESTSNDMKSLVEAVNYLLEQYLRFAREPFVPITHQEIQNASPRERSFLLLQSARDNHTRIVKAVIEAGVDLNRRDYLGQDALQYAISNENCAMIRLILESGQISQTAILDKIQTLRKTTSTLTLKGYLYRQMLRCFEEFLET
jgi:hypothetical protein